MCTCVFTLFHKCKVHNFNVITSIHLFLYHLYFTFDLVLNILLVWGSCVPIFTLQVLEICCPTEGLDPLGTDFRTNCGIGNSSSVSPMWIARVPSSLTNKPTFPWWRIIPPLSSVQWHYLCGFVLGSLFCLICKLSITVPKILF